MAYWDVAEMSKDIDLTSREAAAAAQEMIGVDPMTWALMNSLRLAGAPGWDTAWASAVAASVENPGRNAGVITDGMILSAVQALLNSPGVP